MPSTSTLVQSSFLFILRFTLFFGCNRYLLQSLYSDLKTLSVSPLSSQPSSPALHRDSAIELNVLPSPASAATHLKSWSNKPPLQSTISRGVFSITFMESCMMFVLLMMQGADIFTPRTRLLNWKFSLISLMCTILLVAPLSFSLLFSVGNTSTTASKSKTKSKLLLPRLLLHLLPTFLYLYLFSHIPLPPALQSPNTSPDMMTAPLARLIVVGTTILGLLSGFGAISNSWAYVPMLSRSSEGEPTEQDITTAEFALHSVRNDLQERTAEAERRAGEPTEGNWFSRVFRGDGHQQELQGLNALHYQMSRKLERLRTRRSAALYARTFQGRIFNFGGWLFAVYCIFRIISSIINVFSSPPPSHPSPDPLRKSTSYPDLLTNILAYALYYISPVQVDAADVASLARQISLGLVGVIILTSLRVVLRGVTRGLRITNRTLGASLMTLLLAQLMGIYLLSTIVQLRTSFPPPSSSPTELYDDNPESPTNLFTTIPAFEVFGSLFDWSFLLAAAGSAFGRWSRERVDGVGD